MTHLLPAHERERLESLKRLALVGTEPDPHYDAVCRVASSLFQVPIAYVALLDESKQWFKASCGLSMKQTPRTLSFCARTILFDVPFIVSDAAADARYANNPYVRGAPYIRFYAGVPLALHPGLRVGTLCIADTSPRRLGAEQVERLLDLSTLVVALLRLHDATRATSAPSDLDHHWSRRADPARVAAV